MKGEIRLHYDLDTGKGSIQLGHCETGLRLTREQLAGLAEIFSEQYKWLVEYNKKPIPEFDPRGWTTEDLKAIGR